MSEPPKAVFLSYTSKDAEAARRICAALRDAGIEVWFDQSELRGGDVWDQKIRQQIRDCSLFVPIISGNTDARTEGYFRLEWKLAVERSRLMADDAAFLVPVVIDTTPDGAARVPDKFREVQWTRLPDGETPSAFVQRVSHLLSPGEHVAQALVRAARSARTSWRSRLALLLMAAAAVIAGGYFADRFVLPKHVSHVAPTITVASNDASLSPFTPPAHSVAVLPFTNLSGDPKQEYFADGISEEMINALSHIDALQVAARTSSFAFKGQNVDISTIARKLNVAAILEGSIRRSGKTVRITAQLINAVNGFHIWSQDYDKDLSNILTLQTEIATAVAQQLQVKLLAGAEERIEAGRTHSPEAHDAYLQGLAAWNLKTRAGSERSIAAFGRAVALDPNYAPAYAGLANAYSLAPVFGGVSADETMSKARIAAQQALRLNESLAEAHAVLGFVAAHFDYDWSAAEHEFRRAIELNPSDPYSHLFYSNSYLSPHGRHEEAISEMRLAIKLDPLSIPFQSFLGRTFLWARRYDDALRQLLYAEQLNPNVAIVQERLAHLYPYIGAYDKAIGAETRARLLSGENAASVLAKEKELSTALAQGGPNAYWQAALRLTYAPDNPPESYNTSYGHAILFARLGDTTKALDSLELAYSQRQLALTELAVEPAFDSLRSDARFRRLVKRVGLQVLSDTVAFRPH